MAIFLLSSTFPNDPFCRILANGSFKMRCKVMEMNLLYHGRIEISIIRYQGMNHKVECIISPIPSVYNKHSININEEGERSEGERAEL